MFGHRYFGAAYFGPRYFGAGTDDGAGQPIPGGGGDAAAIRGGIVTSITTGLRVLIPFMALLGLTH